jgi:hypothetical protein
MCADLLKAHIEHSNREVIAWANRLRKHARQIREAGTATVKYPVELL